jgi:lipoate-protein ligase A
LNITILTNNKCFTLFATAMICILSKIHDPYFNLAAEEYLLKNTDHEVFMLWQCHSTIIVGKHQNALAEINYSYVKKNGIKVARRLSGGGTVFHDSGNVNFTFIRHGEKGKLIDYKKHVTPIIDILKKLGIDAQPGNKNEILLNGKKISGNAEHIHKSKILHHGTLLFDSELKRLNSALQITPGKYHDKAVQSNRREVANILQSLHKKISVDEFMTFLFETFINRTDYASRYHLSKSDSEKVNQIALKKYKTWEWIYGYSPKYRFENSINTGDRIIGILLNVENGIIKDAAISGDFFTDDEKHLLADALINQKHKEEVIRKIMNHSLPKQIHDDSIDRIIEGFF